MSKTLKKHLRNPMKQARKEKACLPSQSLGSIRRRFKLKRCKKWSRHCKVKKQEDNKSFWASKQWDNIQKGSFRINWSHSIMARSCLKHFKVVLSCKAEAKNQFNRITDSIWIFKQQSSCCLEKSQTRWLLWKTLITSIQRGEAHTSEMPVQFLLKNSILIASSTTKWCFLNIPKQSFSKKCTLSTTTLSSPILAFLVKAR